MPRFEVERIKTYPRYIITREDFIRAFGFDPEDSFYVELLDYGRKGVQFTLNSEKSDKYKPKDD